MDSTVVKSYDIRGVYPDQVDERFAYLLGKALPRVVQARRVVVGHDARLSSPSLYAALIAGLREAGLAVDALGICPTEFVYYAAGSKRDLDLGVMITASHNPPEYNGFKAVRGGGEPVTGDTGFGRAFELMQAMHDALPESLSDPATNMDVGAEYLGFALSQTGRPDAGGLQVVVDAGNGVAGRFWELLAPRLGTGLVEMNFAPDGSFPAHSPDPTKRENLEPLRRTVVEQGADLGLCYDGDADRVVAVLGDGHVVDGSEMIVCMVERLRESDASPVFGVAQSTCRKALDYLRDGGLEPVITPVGHAKIKHAMRAHPEMVFAGEDAGHYYYRDFFCCDSSLITTLHLLHLAASGRLAPLIASLPGPWYRPEREPSFSFPDRDRALKVCRKAAAAALERWPVFREVTCEEDGDIRRFHAGGAEVVDAVRSAEGVRVDHDDWWFCVRPSGTEPIVRLSGEARSRKLLSDRLEWLGGLFRARV